MEKKPNSQNQGSLADTMELWDATEPTMFGIPGEGKIPTDEDVDDSTDEDVDDVDETEGEEGDETPDKAKDKTSSKKDKDNKGKEKKEDPGQPFADGKGGDEDEDADGEDEGEDEDTDEDEEFYTALATDLKERGLLNVEIEEGKKINKDEFFAIQEEDLENRVDETVQGFFEGIDDEGMAYLKFKRNGGSTSKFLQVYGQGAVLDGLDIEKENDQERFLRYHYQTVDDLDPEDIEEKLKWHKENGNTSKYAAKYYTKAKAEDESRKEKLLADAEKQKQAAIAEHKEYVTTLKTKIAAIDSVKGIALTKKDKETLPDMITKATVKVGNNRYITPFQEGLSKVMKDPEKLALLAKLLQTDFDFSSVEKKAGSEKIKKVRTALENAKQNKRPTSVGTKASKSIADYFS